MLKRSPLSYLFISFILFALIFSGPAGECLAALPGISGKRKAIVRTPLLSAFQTRIGRPTQQRGGETAGQDVREHVDRPHDGAARDHRPRDAA